MAGRPPACDAVDQFASVSKKNAGALRSCDRQRWRHGFHLGVRQPDMRQRRVIPSGRHVGFAAPSRHLTFPSPIRAKHLIHGLARLLMHSLDAYAQDKLASLRERHLYRALNETLREDGIWVDRNGRRLLSFSCNDYLNLTQHPAIKQAAVAAIEEYGAGSGASRLVTGNHPLYAQLEARLAQFKRSEAACVFGSGYLANTGIIPVLIGEDGLVLLDELSHACVYAGAQLSRGKMMRFRHNDVSHARELLATHRSGLDRALIITDGVFSMDGDLAPLEELLSLVDEHDAWLMSDDAHGIGVLGGGH